jgi:diaminopimelate epimerase
MRLSKWHGLRNEYLLLEPEERTIPITPERARLLCDYHAGVGSDGILEVLRVDGDLAELTIWNPDGSTAELSGNGTRIAARWLARRTGLDRVRILVGPREVRAEMLGDRRVRMEMGTVETGPQELLDIGSETVELTPVNVGNPHAVIRREPDRMEILRIGPLVERHTRFPERTNVQLVAVDGPHALRVGVWERGAGETQSSGTSSVAAAAAAVANGWCTGPVTVTLAGGVLEVEVADGRAVLTGEAEEICTVELSPELVLP